MKISVRVIAETKVLFALTLLLGCRRRSCRLS